MRKDDPELMNHLKQLAVECEIITLKKAFQTIENAYTKHDAMMLLAIAINKAQDELEALKLGETMLESIVKQQYTGNGPIDPDS